MRHVRRWGFGALRCRVALVGWGWLLAVAALLAAVPVVAAAGEDAGGASAGR